NLGLVFAEAIIIAGDGAGADVGLLADIGVADVAKVFGLGVLAESGFLHLNEIADPGAFAKHRSGAKAREWPNHAAGRNDRAFDVRECLDRRPVGDFTPGPNT